MVKAVRSSEYRINTASPAAERRVLLVSPYNAARQPWYGISYEFLSVIARVETATIVAGGPAARFGGPLEFIAPELASLRQKALSVLRRKAGQPSVACMQRSELDVDYDLCFYMCQFPYELSEIERVANWRRRARIACAFVIETWPHSFAKYRADLRLLDKFDHVFVMNADCIPQLAQFTSTPISFLATGADCLILPDPVLPDPRSIDMLCIGRRDATVHANLVEFADANGLFYVYDIWRDMLAWDWAAVRRMNAEFIRRARYFLVWDPASLLVSTVPAVADQKVISARYFEGAAGGAVLLGSRSRSTEFDRLFDWPDAVVELPDDPTGMAETILALNADPDRVARISRSNRLQCLRRHDWAHRWAEVLQTLGLAPGQQLGARIAALQQRADRERRADRAAPVVAAAIVARQRPLDARPVP